MAEDHGKDPAAQSFQDEAKQAITEQLSSVSDALEGGLSAASDALLSTTAAARGEAAAAASAVQAWYGAGLGHLRQLDSLMIGTLKREYRPSTALLPAATTPAARPPPPPLFLQTA
jgi:hypothetical protein